MPAFFSRPGVDPYQSVAWEKRTARIEDAGGRVVFEQKGVEVPSSWSALATDLVASRYFAGALGTKERESSVRGLITRVVRAVGGFVRRDGLLAGPKDVARFEAELATLLLTQRAAFNSPVFFNAGIDAKPQASACFILGVEDRLDAILDLASVEGRIFSKGGGVGSNFSRLRGSCEATRAGGHASGPVSFLRGLDALAGAVKSGGRTRRAAKMAILDDDHPDVLPFVRSKALEEDRARALQASGLLATDGPVREGASGFQNQNHSLRATDAFLRAAEKGRPWRLLRRTDGKTAEVVDARALLRAAAVAAHACGDPGLQFADTIASWNPVPGTGEIRASNPCSEFVFLDDTACNLASLNVLSFRRADGSVDVDALRAAVRVLVVGMEAIVGNAAYPTPKVAENSARLRPLGLGLANVGSLLLANATPYDSDGGRGLAAGVMALVGGEATATAARRAARRGPFAEWRRNRGAALAVLARHRKAAQALSKDAVPADLYAAAVAAWGEAETLARRHGLRNAQVTCIAPTGTIAFLMDCDTTGVEPELSLVKEKKLVGGGRLRLVNRAVPEALARLGYDAERAAAILAHVDREGAAEGAPGLRPEHLPVFDVAVPPHPGARALSAAAHLSMMAALQPFVSGAISKTVNLPAEASVDDVERVFLDAWKRGLKAVAVYRDRSKVAQPLAPARGDGGRPAPERAPDSPDGAGRCRECGAPMTTSGACFFCTNCGAATGCG